MYTREYTEKLLKEHDIPMEEFDKWINHQTVPEGGYYGYDVLRFIVAQEDGTEPIFD